MRLPDRTELRWSATGNLIIEQRGQTVVLERADIAVFCDYACRDVIDIREVEAAKGVEPSLPTV